MAENLFDRGYELQNSWEPVGAPQALSSSVKNNIDHITIKDGKFGKQMIFFMKNGAKPKAFQCSPYSACAEYPAGTAIRISSVELQELHDEEGTSIVRASGLAE